MAFTTDFNFGSYGRLNYKDKDLKYYVSYRPNIPFNYMNNIVYKPGNAEHNFRVSNIATANRVAGGVTTFDTCDCVEQGVEIGYSGMFNAITTDGNDTFLKAGYNPHLILSGDTNTSLIYKTAYSGVKNDYGDDHSDLFQITRSDSRLAINKYYGATAGWREYDSIPASSFDQGLIPYVFMFYVQAAGGGGGPSYSQSGGGGGGGGSAVIFMYNFNKGELYIQLGAPGKGGYYNDSPKGGSGSTSLIYDDLHSFSIRVGAGFGASGTDQWITKGGRGGYVSFGRRVSNFQGMTLSDFNSTFKDTCFIMCYGDGGQGGNASRVATGESGTAGTGATMTYTDAVTNYTFAHNGGETTYEGSGGGGGSPTSTGMTAPEGVNKPGTSASDSDRGNGGSGATPKGLAITSRAGGDGGTSEFQIWY